MTRATVKTRSGATVTVEGSPDEVAAVLERLERSEPNDTRRPVQPPSKRQNKTRPTPMGLLSELIAEGFFAKPRELGAVGAALREKGHFYPATTLSPVVLRLVRKKELRRIKEKKRWTYVG